MRCEAGVGATCTAAAASTTPRSARSCGQSETLWDVTIIQASFVDARESPIGKTARAGAERQPGGIATWHDANRRLTLAHAPNPWRAATIPPDATCRENSPGWLEMACGAPALPVLGIMGREGQRFPPRAMSMGSDRVWRAEPRIAAGEFPQWKYSSGVSHKGSRKPTALPPWGRAATWRTGRTRGWI